MRHVISVPAGIARMNFPAFLGLTVAGASAWGGGLIFMGYELGARWESIATQAKKVPSCAPGHRRPGNNPPSHV